MNFPAILRGITATNKKLLRTFTSVKSDSKVSSGPSDVENFIKSLLVGKSKEELIYSSTHKYGGHITKEYFKYEKRFSESNYIVSEFQNRQIGRVDGTDPQDKGNNPLVALPGSPGSGKSTFMVHFPEHPTYLEYVKDVDLLLVSTLTFNSGMEYGKTAFGLRIIFGMLKSMGLLQQCPSLLLWTPFYKHFIAYRSLTGVDSIYLINSIFSEMYPDTKIRFLILIDELSKSKGRDIIWTNADGKTTIFTTFMTYVTLMYNQLLQIGDEPTRVMGDIGSILNEYGNVDVIVSSLSPTFIKDLLTGSQRKVKYVLLMPLLGYPLGMDKYKAWVSRLCILSKIPEKYIDETKIKILKHFYLLYSGHPRSLEYFSKMCNDQKIKWENIINSLQPVDADTNSDTTKTSQSYVSFLNTLIQAVYDHNDEVIQYSLEDANYLSKYVFSTVPVTANDHIAREWLECNKLMLYKRKEVSFIFMAQTIALLKWLDRYRSGNLESIKLQKIQLLVQEFENLTISELWEYIIGISIICHSHDYDRLQSIFGFSQYRGRFYGSYPSFNVMYDEMPQVFNSTNLTHIQIATSESVHLITPNTLHIPIRRQAGFDLRVVMNSIDRSVTNHMYIQCKIGMPMEKNKKKKKSKLNSSEPLPNTLAGVIYYSVRHYIDVIQGTDLGELHIGLYIWADLDDKMLASVTRESVKAEILLYENKELEHDRIKELINTGADKAKIINIKKELVADAVLFIDKYFSHIHILDKKGIEDWLLPSFLSIPELVKAIDK